MTIRLPLVKKDLIRQITKKVTDNGEWVCKQGKITKGQVSIVNNFSLKSYFVLTKTNLFNNSFNNTLHLHKKINPFSFVKPTLDNSFSNIEDAINSLISSDEVIEAYIELIKDDIEKDEFWSGILGEIGQFENTLANCNSSNSDFENTLTNGNFSDFDFDPQYRYRYWVSKKGSSETKEFYSLEECINYLLENKI